MAEGVRIFRIAGDWSATGLYPWTWNGIVYEGGRRFMVA